MSEGFTADGLTNEQIRALRSFSIPLRKIERPDYTRHPSQERTGDELRTVDGQRCAFLKNGRVEPIEKPGLQFPTVPYSPQRYDDTEETPDSE